MNILQQINAAAMRANPQIARIKQAMNTVKTAKDPQAALMGMLGQNQHMQQVMTTIKQHNNDPMEAFRAMAEENGLDPDEILSLIR